MNKFEEFRAISAGGDSTSPFLMFKIPNATEATSFDSSHPKVVRRYRSIDTHSRYNPSYTFGPSKLVVPTAPNPRTTPYRLHTPTVIAPSVPTVQRKEPENAVNDVVASNMYSSLYNYSTIMSPDKQYPKADKSRLATQGAPHRRLSPGHSPQEDFELRLHRMIEAAQRDFEYSKDLPKEITDDIEKMFSQVIKNSRENLTKQGIL